MQAISRARPAFELGLDVCAFLFLPVLVLASRGAAPLVAVAGVLALGLDAANIRAAWYRVRGPLLILAALVLWGLLSSFWAVEPPRSVLIALRLLGMFAAGLALLAAASELTAPRRLMHCLLAGFVVALILAMVQYRTIGALTAPLARRGFIEPALNQAEDGFALLLLPLCAVLAAARQRLAAALLAVATVAVICLLVGEAARWAFFLGLAAALAFYACRKPLARLAAIGSVVLILAAPLVFPPLGGIDAVHRIAHADFKSSLWHRLEIWSFVGARIAERPIFGWGLDSSRAIPGGDTPIPEGYPGQLSLPLHPHNAALQLWLELGLPGAVLLALIAAWIWLALGAANWPRLYAAAASASLVTAFGVGLGSYGVWQEWWISTEFLTLFLILVMARLVQPRPDTRTGSTS